MFAIRNGLRSASRLSGLTTRAYSSTIVCTPPEAKISGAEKIFAYLCIAGCTVITPMYMVPNFEKYAKKGT